MRFGLINCAWIKIAVWSQANCSLIVTNLSIDFIMEATAISQFWFELGGHCEEGESELEANCCCIDCQDSTEIIEACLRAPVDTRTSRRRHQFGTKQQKRKRWCLSCLWRVYSLTRTGFSAIIYSSGEYNEIRSQIMHTPPVQLCRWPVVYCNIHTCWPVS